MLVVVVVELRQHSSDHHSDRPDLRFRACFDGRILYSTWNRARHRYHPASDPWLAKYTLEVRRDGVISGTRQDTTSRFDINKYRDKLTGKVDYNGDMELVLPTWGGEKRYHKEYKLKYKNMDKSASGTWKCRDVDHGNAIITFTNAKQ